MTISSQPSLSCKENTIRVTCPQGSAGTESEFVISNTGGGLLTGSIGANRTWITVEPSQVGTETSQKFLVRIATDSINGERFSTGTIRINTNGGGKTILVIVTHNVGATANISTRQKKTIRITVYDEDGKTYHLEKTRKSGGEGVIYLPVHARNLCAKLYHPHHRTKENSNKLGFMTKEPINITDPDIIVSWPITRLYEDREHQTFLGFLMDKVDMTRFHEFHLLFDKKDRVIKFGYHFNWKMILASALKIAVLVSIIHKNGHRIGDLNDRNILISREAKVALIDCDSFQVTDASKHSTYQTKVGTPEYLPPELARKGALNTPVDRLYSDRFALAILIFRLLMDGVHPFQSKGFRVRNANNTADKIQLGYFPYTGNVDGVIPPLFAPPYSRLPVGVQALFHRCFVSGHKDPRRRPAAEEWVNLLENELNNLRVCKKNSAHLFSNEFPICPWCETEEKDKSRIKVTLTRKIIENEEVLPEKSPIKRAPSPQAVELIENGCMSENPFTRERSRKDLEKNGISPVERTLALINGRGRLQYRALIQNLADCGPEGTRAIISLLKHDDSAISDYVVSFLISKGISSLPYLIESLENDNSTDISQYERVFLKIGTGCSRFIVREFPGISGKKREILTDILIKRGEDSIQPVTELLSNDDTGIRSSAETVLIKIGEPSVLPLIQALSHNDSFQREQVERIIKKIGKPAISPLSSLLSAKNLVVLEFVRDILTSFREDAVPQLIQLLSSKNPFVVAEASNLLVTIGNPAIPDLLLLLDTGNKQLSASVAVILIGLGDNAIQPLIKMLFSKHRLQRAHAAEALIIIERRALPYLITSRKVATLDEKKEIDKVLLKIGVPEIISYYSDKSTKNYRDLNEIIKLFPDEGYDAINKIIFGTGGPVQKCAVFFLVLCRKDWYPLFLEELLNRDNEVHAVILNLIAKIGQHGIPLISEIIHSGDEEIQIFAKRVLPEICTDEQVCRTKTVSEVIDNVTLPIQKEEPVPPLNIEQLFQSCLILNDEGTRKFISECERKSLDPLQFLFLSLNNCGYDEKVFAASVLSHYTRAVQGLIQLLDKDEDTRDFAQWVLTRIGGPAVSPLIQTLGCDSVPIKNATASTLGKIGIPAIRPLIEAMKDDNKGVRSGSVAALLKIGRPVLIPLIESIRNKSALCSKEAESLLVRTKSHSLPLLISQIGEDPQECSLFFSGCIEKIGKYSLPVILKKILSLDEYSRKTEPLIRLYLKISSGEGLEIKRLVNSISETQKDILFSLVTGPGDWSVPICIELLDYSDKQRPRLKQKIIEYPDIAAPILIQKILNAEEEVIPLIVEIAPSLDINCIDLLISGVKSSQNTKARINCINIISEIKNEKCIPILLDTLPDKDFAVSNCCERALIAFDGLAVIPVIERMKNARGREKEKFQAILLGIGDPAIGPLISSSEQKNKSFRNAAIMTLEALGLKIDKLKNEIG